MCLEECGERKVLTENKTVYKIVVADDVSNRVFCTPFRYAEIPLQERMDTPMADARQGRTVHTGYHTLPDYISAVRLLYAMRGSSFWCAGKLVIVKGYIPKGSAYYEGTFFSSASMRRYPSIVSESLFLESVASVTIKAKLMYLMYRIGSLLE